MELRKMRNSADFFMKHIFFCFFTVLFFLPVRIMSSATMYTYSAKSPVAGNAAVSNDFNLLPDKPIVSKYAGLLKAEEAHVNKIRRQPYAVVLFDEIEKAHTSVFDVFLQIMDEGKLHDKLGKTGDFSNAVVIFTSNIGSNYVVERFNNNEIPASGQLRIFF